MWPASWIAWFTLSTEGPGDGPFSETKSLAIMPSESSSNGGSAQGIASARCVSSGPDLAGAGKRGWKRRGGGRNEDSNAPVGLNGPHSLIPTRWLPPSGQHLYKLRSSRELADSSRVTKSTSCRSIARVWAVDDGEKVKKDDLRHPLADSADNEVWDGERITIFAARNEIIAFQLIIEAGPDGAAAVDVALYRLSNETYTIQNNGSDDPFDYVGKHIELFTEHYLNIEKRTSSVWHWYEETRAMDIHGDEYLGWVPDALIPFQAPPGKGGAPFAIEPSCNQGIWVDVYVPRDAPAGEYIGDLEIRVGDDVTHRLPVSLRMLDFVLPDETHFRNMFFFESRGEVNELVGIADNHPVKPDMPEFDVIEGRYHQMAHRHRADLIINGDLDYIKSHYARYLSGQYYRPERGYEGPGEGIGHGTYSIGTYDQPAGIISGFVPNTEEGWRNVSDAWVTWFEENLPDVEIFKYMYDEPYHREDEIRIPRLAEIKERAGWVKSNPGPGRRLTILATTGGVRGLARQEMEGLVDIWQTSCQTDIERNGNVYGLEIEGARELQAQGCKIGMYNGSRPNHGTVVADTDAVDFRVTPWVGWKYGIDQYFLWHTNLFRHGSRETNPFDLGRGSNSIGDGTLFYPGQEQRFPADDRGLPGPISSIRMKNWRRGQQDYEYFWLAKQAGLHEELAEIVEAVVPAALSEVDQHAPPPWAIRGHAYEKQRRRLAELLENAASA